MALIARQFQQEVKNVGQGAIMSLLRLRRGGEGGGGEGEGGDTCVISRHERTRTDAEDDGGMTRARGSSLWSLFPLSVLMRQP